MYKELKKELEKLEMEYEIIQDIEKYLVDQNEIINIGSRVIVIHENGTTQKGRVIKFSQNLGQWLVNRDGYAAYIGVPNNRLKNLSVGIEGKLEKKAWFIGNKIYDLKKILHNANLPDNLKERSLINIKVVSTNYVTSGHNLIVFEEKNVAEAREIQLPTSAKVTAGGYYQLIIKNDEIEKVLPISKEKYNNDRNQ